MARRGAARPRGGQGAEEYDEREQGAGRRPPRRKGGNEGLYIALGAAGVIGLIALIIFAGGSPEESGGQEAKETLKKFMQACIENREADGMRLVDPRWVLREENPKQLKQWDNLSPEDKADLTAQAYRWVRQKILQDLQLKNMQEVNILISAAEPSYKSIEKRVDLYWTMGGTRWIAGLSNITGQWKVLDLGKAR
jgi:hypothetical protein